MQEIRWGFSAAMASMIFTAVVLMLGSCTPQHKIDDGTCSVEADTAKQAQEMYVACLDGQSGEP